MDNNLIKANFAGGKRFLELSADKLESQLAFAEKQGINCFQVTANFTPPLPDLSLLNPAATSGLFIQFENLLSHADLNRFRQLEILIAGYSSYPNQVIDLGNFPHIKVLHIYHNKNYIHLDKLEKTVRLTLWKFQPASRTLAALANYKELVYATLTMATINSLDGIENLPHLKELDLRNIKTLQQFFTNPVLSRLQLEQLKIAACKNLAIESLPNIASLKVLTLNQMGIIQSIESLVPKFPNLEVFAFTESVLADGNIDYLKKFLRLKQLFIDNKKHYSCKEKELNAYLKARAGTA
jgi:hypothetical protein